jgi:hypothetical protein
LVNTDEELMQYIEQVATTDFHPCCSVRVDEKTFQVDPALSNLFVVDASSLHQNVDGNLQAWLYATGLEAAHVLARPPVPKFFVAQVRAIVGSISRPSLYGDFPGVWPRGQFLFDADNLRALFTLNVTLPRIGTCIPFY